ncbi:major capsid protein [Peromfec virus RodF5_15]|uniref:Major capsid protein n=1 Tax=Peromfec virus RodF5_15 TaxID=2929337 RepID=A0A976R8C2_9VIRU|nr:major capsid protein [Peromfec virus RodF5_15]
MSNPIFSTVKAPSAKSSNFFMPHEVKSTTSIGRITPFYNPDIAPGDRVRVDADLYTKFLPMLAPILHRINVYVHCFFVPYRLAWEPWKRFITGSDDGFYSSDDEVSELPILRCRNSGKNLYADWVTQDSSLLDYLNVGMSTVGGKSTSGLTLHINILPVLAFWRVWLDYYRDENLDDERTQKLIKMLDAFKPGINDLEQLMINTNLAWSDWGNYFFSCPFRAWDKDYFTGALPFLQKGGSVSMPLNGSAPVFLDGSKTREIQYFEDGTGTAPSSGDTPLFIGQLGGNGISAYDSAGVNPNNPDSIRVALNDNGEVMNQLYLNPNGTLYADLSQGSALTINELRRANALQRWEELNARGGSRYIEQILSHFGVRSSDARLQRAEYLGGSKIPVSISEVFNTNGVDDQISSLDSQQVLGGFAGHAQASASGFLFDRTFEEHGMIFCLMTVVPKAGYFQGADRIFLKRDRMEFIWPVMANLGEQPIYNEELFYAVNGIPADPASSSETFGYTPRYAEYKYEPDRVHGLFRSSLEFWHMARHFSNQPQLNSQFISLRGFDPGVFPVALDVYNGDVILNQILLRVHMRRKLPFYGTPTL